MFIPNKTSRPNVPHAFGHRDTAKVTPGVCTNHDFKCEYLIHDKFYQCLTCNLSPNHSLCPSCAEKCHKGHNLVERHGPCFCDCAVNLGKEPCKCCDQLYLCTKCLPVSDRIKQMPKTAYQCKTCGIVGNQYICCACKERCHKGHDIVDVGLKSFTCQCSSNGHKCKATTPFTKQQLDEFLQSKEKKNDKKENGKKDKKGKKHQHKKTTRHNSSHSHKHYRHSHGHSRTSNPPIIFVPIIIPIQGPPSFQSPLPSNPFNQQIPFSPTTYPMLDGLYSSNYINYKQTSSASSSSSSSSSSSTSSSSSSTSSSSD